AATFLDALDADDDAIAVHCVVQHRTRDGDVASRLDRARGRDEPVAGRMRLQPSNEQIHLLGQSEAVPADLYEIAGRDEVLDVALERGAVVATDFENLQELARTCGMVDPLAHHREHLVSGEHCVDYTYERSST